jgi:hypothetical protein
VVGISYTSDAWIITQVRKYEEEIGTTLFRKAVSQEGAALGLCQNITTYEQKRHLYISQKIRTANGVFDLIRNSAEKLPSGDTVSLLLEAGSTVTRVAEIIAQNLHLLPLKWDICTHNLGVIECLGKLLRPTETSRSRCRRQVRTGHTSHPERQTRTLLDRKF